MAPSKPLTGKKKVMFDGDDETNDDTNDDSSGASSSDSSSSSSSSTSSSSPSKLKKGAPAVASKKRTSSSGDIHNDAGSNLRLTVNKKYATEYQQRKEREELRQIQLERQHRGISEGDGPDDDDDDDDERDSSDEDEDEDGALLTPSANVQFLKTIKALRRKEDVIYDPNTRFFEDLGPENDTVTDDDDDDDGPRKRKPQRFKDVVREQILEQIEEEGREGIGQNKPSGALTDNRSKLAYDKQQDELRQAFLNESSKLGDDGKAALDVDDADDDGDDWMVVKKKAAAGKDDDMEREATEHLKEIEKISQSGNTFKDPRGEIEDGDRFLFDFIKNKKWIDSHDHDGEEDDNSANDTASTRNENNRDDDESSLDGIDRADDYEAKYNFRFEQAAAQTASTGALLSIQTYARGQTMNTVRRQDTTRKDKRQERKERKAADRKAKEEQLKRLKNAKRQEMNEKLSQVKAVIGAVDDNSIDEVTIMKLLEGDYDPEKFENAMKHAYGDDFYNKEDGEWKTDLDVRQSLKEDDEGDVLVGRDDVDGGMYDTYDDDGGKDEDDQMQEGDHDYDETEEWNEDGNQGYEQEGSHEESELEKKLKSKMQNELYKLDYEDIVAGMPTRFKYREVESNDYGLTTQEILFARDASLKQFVSLKKLAPYNEQGEFHPGSRKRRRFREMLKQDLEEMFPQPLEEEAPKVADDDNQEDVVMSGETMKKKRRRLKKGKKKSGCTEDTPESIPEKKSKGTESNRTENQKSNVGLDSSMKEPEKRRRKKSGTKGEAPGGTTLSEASKEHAQVDLKHQEYKLVRCEDTMQALSDEYKSGSIVQLAKSNKHVSGEKENLKKKKRKKSKQDKIAGLNSSRLAAYGL